MQNSECSWTESTDNANYGREKEDGELLCRIQIGDEKSLSVFAYLLVLMLVYNSTEVSGDGIQKKEACLESRELVPEPS
jgi:hypothetical protein